jgi:predicted DsbA family dithiol-disulfide isomerase
MALASEHISADMVSVGDFPHLTGRYHAYGVPKIVINEEIQVEGCQPEAIFVEHVMKVMGLGKNP